MSQPAPIMGLSSQFRSSLLNEEPERRKKRLMGLLAKGLPTLPNYLLDLNAMLSSPTVDLRKVGKIIRTDPILTSHVLRLCNSALFGLRHRVLSIEQAAVLLGTERLRTLVLTCSVMQFAGKHLSADSMMSFWQHSFLAALLSERIARQVDYPEKEQAYLGGLLHDLGQLPLLMLYAEEVARQRPLPPENWLDNPRVEREYFGMDHGKVGRWMGVSWNFMPSFVDVFEHHHDPENAHHDPYLVGIVSAADQFLRASEIPIVQESPAETTLPIPVTPHTDTPPFLLQCFPLLSVEERLGILETLQTEYMHVLPLVQLGLSAVASEPPSKQKSVKERNREETTSSHRG
jgi:HD-like signal output (HDOD) protein